MCLQCFAIFVPPIRLNTIRFQAALEMMDIFYEQVIRQRNIKLIYSQDKEDVLQLKNDEVGAILTLEGSDAIRKVI